MTPTPTPSSAHPPEILGLSQDDIGKRARFHMVTGIDIEGTIDTLQPDPDWPLILVTSNGVTTYLVADHVAGYTLYPDAAVKAVDEVERSLAEVLVKLAPNPDPRAHKADDCLLCTIMGSNGRAA